MLAKILNLFILFLPISLFTQSDSIYVRLESKLDSLFESVMYEQRIPGAGIIIVKDNKVILKKGYGFTRLGEEINYVNPDSTVFRIGSITKSFTALSLLQQVDNGNLNLHHDINTYLKSFKINNRFDTEITPYHLLTHSAGFDELGGRRVFNENEQIPLKQFLQNNLRQIRSPGEVSAYSTYGIALAGLLIEELNNKSLEGYMIENIWAPLKMNMTSIDLPEEHGNITSLGYEIYNNINIPQPWEWYHTFPASSINSTISDMGKYMQMLLNNGSYNDIRILSPELISKMMSQQSAVHSKSDGFTCGLYERHWNGNPSINHGGEMLGYSSFMTLFPEENLGIFVVHHHEGTRLRYLAIETVVEEFLTAKEISETPSKLTPEIQEFVGEYIWLSNCQTCEGSEQQDKWRLESTRDNKLSGFNRIFYQVEPLVFKSTDGERTMCFKRDSNGQLKYMSLGNINVFEKIK